MSTGTLRAPRCPRYWSLDLWRGMACLLIVVLHGSLNAPSYGVPWPPHAFLRSGALDQLATLASYGIARFWVGVPMFFVISGYCIAAAADAVRQRGDSPRRYFTRRLRRIYPPYWALVILTVAAGFALDVAWPGFLRSTEVSPSIPIPHPAELSAQQWIGNLTLTESWRYQVATDDRLYVTGHVWTLCYEEQFYLVMGLVLLVFRRRLFIGAAVVTLLVGATGLLFDRLGLSPNGFFFDRHWYIFASGILVYWKVNYAGTAGVWVSNLALGGLAAGIALAYPASMMVSTANQYHQSLVFGFGFALVLSVLHGRDRRLCERGFAKPLLFCGRRCYSIYLVHWLVVRICSTLLWQLGVRTDLQTLLITVPLCVAATLLCAEPFYRLIERRFLNAPIVRPACVPEQAH